MIGRCEQEEILTTWLVVGEVVEVEKRPLVTRSIVCRWLPDTCSFPSKMHGRESNLRNVKGKRKVGHVGAVS